MGIRNVHSRIEFVIAKHRRLIQKRRLEKLYFSFMDSVQKFRMKHYQYDESDEKHLEVEPEVDGARKIH